MNRIVAITIALSLLTGHAQGVQAKKKKKVDLTLVKKDSVNTDYKKIVTGAQVRRGLFTVIFKEKEGKLYFELPDTAFQKTYMLSNRIASTSDTQDYVAGQMVTTPFLISFTKDERNVYMNKLMTNDVVKPGDAMAPSFKKNFMNPILKAFKIAARNKKSVVIDVTNFFGTNEKCISPLKESGPIAKLLGNSNTLKGTFVGEASGITEAKAFARNIEVKSTLSFTTTGVVTKPYSVGMHRSLFVLPDDPMPMRLQDNRVGYFDTYKSIYSTDCDRIDSRSYINRWRLEPRPEDRERYFKGELVEPLKPIVFYVDTAFPEKWRSTIRAGIEDWNRAFETAGFKHAVKALDYPACDSVFDPDDMRYNCFKYAATATANAMGPSYIDPRTGEILAADVIWYHNIVSLLHNWRFVQTAAVDQRVRKTTFDDELMCESMRYAAAHEVGHTLGLMHNMGASYSFPVDSLRSPRFTQQYGTTPSIMDYARNNYVAQPGDLERGVKLTPPQLGVYDIYAINWGYRLIPGADTPEAEKPTLDAWIAEKAGDPMYEFGAQQVFSTVDPTDQTEDLGNDHIKASNYGISNLKLLMQHLTDWTLEPGERYDNVEKVYLEITKQYGRYVRHVLPIVGGLVYEEIRQGDGKPTGKHYVGKAEQRRAVDWLLGQMRTYDSWLTPTSLIGKLDVDMNINDKLRRSIVSGLLNGAVLYRIQEGGQADPARNYQLDDYLSYVTDALFKAPTGGKLTTAERELQGAAISQLISQSGLKPKAAGASSSSSLDDYDRFCMADALLLPCDQRSLESTSFARYNLGVSALTADQLGVVATGRLRRVLQKYRTYQGSATGSTRDFYAYQILLIEKLLNNK